MYKLDLSTITYVSFGDKIRALSSLLLVLFLVLTSCTQPSEEPVSEELTKTGVPTFSGQVQISLTTSTASYTLSGECDPISKGLEWSYDNSTWTTIAAGCVNSAFSINVLIPKIRTVYVRAKTKLGHTEPGRATIRFILPPTSSAFQVVSAGSKAEIGDVDIPFTASGTTSGAPGTSGSHKLDSHLTGITYGY